MSKKWLIAVLALMMCFLLTGCDTSQAYEGVLERLHSQDISLADKLQENENSTEPEQPEKEQQTEEQPETGQVQLSEVYPTSVPAPEYLTLISERWENENLLTAQYLMSEQQLANWKSGLQKAGFSTGEPMSNGEWTITLTTLAQSAGSAADYRVVVEMSRTVQPVWPSEFSMFPAFEGQGTLSTEVSQDGGASMMLLVSEGESREAYNDYLLLLKQSGFENRGYGLYVKSEADRELEVDTDGAWQEENVLRLRFYIRPLR